MSSTSHGAQGAAGGRHARLFAAVAVAAGVGLLWPPAAASADPGSEPVNALAARTGLPGLASASDVLGTADMGGVAATRGLPGLPAPDDGDEEGEDEGEESEGLGVPGLSEIMSMAALPDLPGMPGAPGLSGGGDFAPEAARMASAPESNDRLSGYDGLVAGLPPISGLPSGADSRRGGSDLPGLPKPFLPKPALPDSPLEESTGRSLTDGLLGGDLLP